MAFVGLLRLAHPTAVHAQENDLLSAAQIPKVKAVPLTMELSRRAYGVTVDMVKLVRGDAKLHRTFRAIMGASLEEIVRLLDSRST